MGEASSAQADAFRKLAARITVGNTGDEVPKVILVTSAVAQEGKTTTACNLAAALAEIQDRVVLVDLDLVRPCVDRFLGTGERRGIRDVIAGEVGLEEVRQRVALEHGRSLEVVGAGTPQVVDSAGAVASPRLEEIFAALADSADIVIVDTPPALAVSLATLASRCVDAVLAVARVEVLTVDLAEEFQESLAAMPAAKLGFVLTAAEKEGRRYGAGYGYGYGGPQFDDPPPLERPRPLTREPQPAAELRAPSAPPLPEHP
jgi:Mrp family chromosome partitioning ATPase